MIKQVKDFCATYKYYYFKIWTMHAVVLGSFFVISPVYFLYSMLIYPFYFGLMQIIVHEYVSHGYIKPRNSVIEFFCLLLMYMHELSVQTKREYHLYHHKHWKNPKKDPTCQKMHGVSVLGYVFSFSKPVSQQIDGLEPIAISPWATLLDKHTSKIYWASTILLFLLLPFPWFIVVCVYLPWFNFLTSNLHDQLFHGKLKSGDKNWYVFLYGSAAWHHEHHKRYHTWYHGPGLWKWVNPCWYFQMLLFTPSRTSAKS